MCLTRHFLSVRIRRCVSSVLCARPTRTAARTAVAPAALRSWLAPAFRVPSTPRIVRVSNVSQASWRSRLTARPAALRSRLRTSVHASSAVTSAMTHVASVVARLHAPLLDPLGPYAAALSDAHTRSDPVIESSALSQAARTTTVCPSCHKHVAVHGGNFWTHLYACDRAALAPNLQIAFDRARTSHVAPNSALALPPHDGVSEQARNAIADALPLDVVRANAARRSAENEALLSSLFSGSATVSAAGASSTADIEASWKRIASRVNAFDDGAQLEQTVRESEQEAHLYASAVRDINECNTPADVDQCRAKLKREWASAFDDNKRRRTGQQPQTTAAAPKLVQI